MDKDTKAMVRHKANLWQKYIRGGKKRVEIMKDYKKCSKSVKMRIKESIRSY